MPELKKSREHELRSCVEKRSYKTFVQARRAARKTGSGVQPYNCRYCNLYHTGHDSNYDRPIKRKRVQKGAAKGRFRETKGRVTPDEDDDLC